METAHREHAAQALRRLAQILQHLLAEHERLLALAEQQNQALIARDTGGIERTTQRMIPIIQRVHELESDRQAAAGELAQSLAMTSSGGRFRQAAAAELARRLPMASSDSRFQPEQDQAAAAELARRLPTASSGGRFHQAAAGELAQPLGLHPLDPPALTLRAVESWAAGIDPRIARHLAQTGERLREAVKRLARINDENQRLTEQAIRYTHQLLSWVAQSAGGTGAAYGPGHAGPNTGGPDKAAASAGPAPLAFDVKA
ncbi:flagellar export chaperone FlgN [Alicyclobacillus sp.]|uniref:flagellar export chaperone FlgN n=1 Tax=Alicyclobacillus sp. TaxID=61169 RepID=UPI0025C2EE01|nr:flagellar export chaperone FlgN [Alicyclobacillus sp.]MCL6516743.1 flagellar protein FlgN [Alicyclobacillus sp.]